MKTCFSLLLGMVLLGCLAVTPAGATLVLHYDFQTLGSSAPEVTDLAGGNNNGTLGLISPGGTTHITDGSGPGGSNYLKFTSTAAEDGGWVQADNANGALDLTGSFTIATRFKGHAASAAETMLGRYDDGANPGFRLHMTADEKVEAYFVTSTGSTFEYGLVSSASAYASDWHLAVLKYDGTAKSLSLYVDYDGLGGGEKIVVTQTNLGNPVPVISAYTQEFRVGVQSSASGAILIAPRGFNDGLDDVRVYDTALSDADVADLIPEPTTLGLLAIGGLLAIRRRRR